MPLLWKNLVHALAETKTEPVRAKESAEHHSNNHTTNPPRGDVASSSSSSSSAGVPPARKKARKERLLGFRLHDPFQIWIHIKEFEATEDQAILLPEALPTTLGVKLTELGVPGIINGLAGVPGGFVDKHVKLVNAGAAEVPTAAGPCTLAQLKLWGVLLHQAVQSRLEKDSLDTTPQRIADMLAPDLTPAEFKGVRRRIYDTVILGKGLKVDDGTDDIPVANTAQSVHDIEKVWLLFISILQNGRLQAVPGSAAVC